MPPLRHDALPQIDVRARAEIASRHVLVRRLRCGGRVAGRVVVDAALVAGVASLVRAAYWSPAASLPPSGAPSIVTALLVALLALGTAGEFATEARPRSSVVVPLVACTLLALALPVLSAEGARGWTGAPLAVLTITTGAVLTLLVVVRRSVARGAMRGPALRGAVIVGRERDLTAALAALDGAERHQVLECLTGGDSSAALPSVASIARRLAAGDVHELVVVSVVRALTLRAIAATCWRAGVRCLVAFDARDVRMEPTVATTIGGFPALELVPAKTPVPWLLLKRAVDVVLTLLLLPIAAPLGLLVAAAIRLESRGPVLYRQTRVGLGGREFVIWKFRSMFAGPGTRRDALEHLNHYGGAPLFKLKGDPRITRVGRFLRRTSLDELPQLINVLRGEMSLVGPRPPLPDEVARYAPHHLVRLTVVPGMTGPWQVGGRNLITDFEEIVRMEREYIDEWSLALDFRIMLRTVGVVVTGTGAY